MKTNCETYFRSLALTCPSGHLCFKVEQFGIWYGAWTGSIFSFFLQNAGVWMTSIHTLTWHVWFRCYERKAAWRLRKNWWRIRTRHYQIPDATWPIWPLLNEPSSTWKFGNKLWKLGEIQRDNLAERNDKGPGGITTWISTRDENPPITAWRKRMRDFKSNSFHSNELLTESTHWLSDLSGYLYHHFSSLSPCLYFIASSLISIRGKTIINRLFYIGTDCVFLSWYLEKLYVIRPCLTTVTETLDNKLLSDRMSI